MMPFASLLICIFLLTGCASDPNSRWFEKGMINFEVLEIGQTQYKLAANGAGNHNRDDVQRAFLIRAGELCKGKNFNHDYKTSPRQYSSSGGGFSFIHDAFKVEGVVKCN